MAYLGKYSGLDYYSIRPMTNTMMGLYSNISGSTGYLTISDINAQNSWNLIPYSQSWAIESNSGYCTIKNGNTGYHKYISAPSNSTNGADIITSSQLTSNCQWEFERYTGSDIDNAEAIDMDMTITRGQTFLYNVAVSSTRYGINGPASYFVRGADGEETTIATVNSQTGELTANNVGTVQLHVTYAGAPFSWYWIITIRTAGCKPYREIEEGDLDNLDVNCLHYAFWTDPKGDVTWPSAYFMEQYVGNVSDSNEILFGNSIVSSCKENLEQNFLGNNAFPYTWTEVVSCDGGWDVILNDNQWLVAFRVGINENTAYYHFWYRTDTGI